MKIELFHNKIIADTVTPEFRESFNSNLVPKLAEKYGNSIIEIQMYEDYLNSGFSLDGEFYYPLTLLLQSGLATEWIKWNVSGKKQFENRVPYAYIGSEQINFEIVENVPEEFKNAINGKQIYFDYRSSAPFSIKTSAVDKTFLAGKYSQSFVDAMAVQITKCIEKSFSVSGSENGGYELVLVFAPETYMEHVVENVTYRRLLITARGCSAKDLWIKWTNLKANTPLSVSDDVKDGEILFELADVVPQKVREKEYRFLVRASADKYQYAMGRKNITEWRDLIKRVIKRGELTPCEAREEKTVKASELEKRDEKIDLMVEEIKTVRLEDCLDDKNYEEHGTALEDDMAARLEESLVSNASPDNSLGASDSTNSDLAALLRDAIGLEASEPVIEPEVVEEGSTDTVELSEEFSEEIAKLEEKIAAEETQALLEDEIRRKIEAEMRERFELEAKQRMEEENLRLVAEREKLKAENERLAKLALEMENERIRKEAEQKEEAEKLRREIEARERAEQKEKERLADAARLAIIEEQRLATVKAEQEAEARLLEEKRKAEEERLLREKEAEERRRKETLEEAEKAVEAVEPVYVSKNARILFRRQVDPNITKRIHEIILTTIKYLHKEDVYIKIKATVPDATTVNLHFVKIPENETELLINIIKVLGKSDLGITKVFLE